MITVKRKELSHQISIGHSRVIKNQPKTQATIISSNIVSKGEVLLSMLQGMLFKKPFHECYVLTYIPMRMYVCTYAHTSELLLHLFLNGPSDGPIIFVLLGDSTTLLSSLTVTLS